MNQQILISQIEEIGADIGEPDCKLVEPFIFGKDKLVEPLDQRIDVSNRQVWDYQN